MAVSIPNKTFVASFDVDAQNTFTPLCSDELPVPEGHLIVDELNQQATKANLRLGSKDAHHPNAVWVATKEKPILTPLSEPQADIVWPVHAIPGTKGFDLLDGLPTITDYDYFVWKGVELDMHPYGACYHDLNNKVSTGVIEFLKDRNIKTVIVGGLATDYCVKHTVFQLLDAGFDVVLNLAACRGVTPEGSNAAVDAMKKKGIRIAKNADQIVNES